MVIAPCRYCSQRAKFGKLTVLTELDAVLTGVAIERVVEEHLVRSCFAQEHARLLTHAGRVEVGSRVQPDVDACRPRAHLVAEEHIRRVHVAQLGQRLSEPRVRVRVASDIGKA